MVSACTWVTNVLVGHSNTEVVMVDTGEVRAICDEWRDEQQCVQLDKQPEILSVRHLPTLSKL